MEYQALESARREMVDDAMAVASESCAPPVSDADSDPRMRLPRQLDKARVLACATDPSGHILWSTRAFRLKFGSGNSNRPELAHPAGPEPSPFVHGAIWARLIDRVVHHQKVDEVRVLMRCSDDSLLALTAAAAPAPAECIYGSAALVLFEPEREVVPLSDIPGEGFRALYDNAVIGIYRSTAEGRPHRANPAFVRMMGYETESEWLAAATSIAREWYVDPVRRDEFVAEIAGTGAVANFVSEIYRHATGEKIWVSETAREVHDPDGALAYYEGTIEDITARVRAEQELRRAVDSADRLSALVARTLQKANAIAMDDWQEPGETGARPDTFSELEAYLAEFNLPDASDSTGDSALTPGSGRFSECHRELALLIRALIHSKRVAEDASRAKSKFLANISHELRTPLNAIIGYSEILMEDCGASGAETSAEDARRITGAARHLLSMINNVLDLSKLEAGRMKLRIGPARLEDIIARASDIITPLATTNNNVYVVDDQVGAIGLFTDSEKVLQSLLNLLSNAAKFTRNGEIRLTVALDDSGEKLRFTVADTGIGMRQEDLEKLFQPFVQVDANPTRRVGGTGLGLAITREFAELMGGTVELTSEFGKGSCFCLILPARLPLNED